MRAPIVLCTMATSVALISACKRTDHRTESKECSPPPSPVAAAPDLKETAPMPVIDPDDKDDDVFSAPVEAEGTRVSKTEEEKLATWKKDYDARDWVAKAPPEKIQAWLDEVDAYEDKLRAESATEDDPRWQGAAEKRRLLEEALGARP